MNEVDVFFFHLQSIFLNVSPSPHHSLFLSHLLMRQWIHRFQKKTIEVPVFSFNYPLRTELKQSWIVAGSSRQMPNQLDRRIHPPATRCFEALYLNDRAQLQSPGGSVLGCVRTAGY